jgi:hypothetical protein
LRPTGSARTRVTGVKVPIPKVRFTAGRRQGLAGGNGGTARAAVPRFRRRSVTGTIGTGGALSRTTPRRGTFGGRRSLGRRPALGGGSSGGGISPRRGRFGSTTSGRSVFGRRAFGPGTLRRNSMGRASFGSTSSGRGSRAFPGGGPSAGRGSPGRRPAPRLRIRRGSVRARVLRFLDWGRGGYR